MNTILSEILFDTGYLFIIISTFIVLFFGLALIIMPALTLKFNAIMDRWITPKNISIKSEPFFYKHSKIAGILLISGSLFVLYVLTSFNFYALIPYLPKQFSAETWGWLLRAGHIFFFIAGAFIFIFGLLVFIRPSVVKKFENGANRWFSTQRFFLFINANIDFFSKWLITYPRIIGFFITVFALIILFFLLPGFKNLNILGI